jgi:Endonuclease/Exonuclease/phosphatase family
VPDRDRRPVGSAFHTPVRCPSCERHAAPRDLLPSRQGAWGCLVCVDADDVAAWRLSELREVTREQVCGTWNMQKYGSSSPQEKRDNVLQGLVALLRSEDPDWVLVQEVTDGGLFADDLRSRLARERLHYDCSGQQVTLGAGSGLDHYILIYNVTKVAIVVGPRHVGANEAPERKAQIPYWRDKDGGVEGKVVPHRGSVVWLTCSLPYRGPHSLTWVMGVHTSPSGSTNNIATQIHEIMTHAAKLRHQGVPVVLAGDWYMQNCAPRYAEKLDTAEWTLIAPFYGTSLKHKNKEHKIQTADHLVVSEVCDVAWVRQYVPTPTNGPTGWRLSHLNAPPCIDPESFVARPTPEHVWSQMNRWMDMSVDHTPVLARFTMQPIRGRTIFVPGNLRPTIDDYRRSGLTSSSDVGDQGGRQLPPSQVRPSADLFGGPPPSPFGGPASSPFGGPPPSPFGGPASSPFGGPLSFGGLGVPFGGPNPFGGRPRESSPRGWLDTLPSGGREPRPLPPTDDRLPDESEWRVYLQNLPNVELFGSHQSGESRLTCTRLPSLKQQNSADCGVHAAYNARILRGLVEKPTKSNCALVMALLLDEKAFRDTAGAWKDLHDQVAKTDGLHLDVIGRFLGDKHLVLPLLSTDRALAWFEEKETARVVRCAEKLTALKASPGADTFVAGRVQLMGSETHALAGVLRSYRSHARLAWEAIFTDSSPGKAFVDDTLTLFKTLVKWLEAPELMLKRSMQ